MLEEIPRRVLLAEDDEVSARAARTILERLGCTVDLAVTGVEAITHFGRNPYHLVLMDWLMPEMDGFDATAKIRLMPRGHSTPVVGTTARRSRLECVSAGMNDLIPKPFDRAKIESALEKWAPRENSAANHSWSDLVRRVQLGEANAVEELYCDLARWVRPFVMRALGPKAAEDRVHEAYMLVVERIRQGGLRDSRALLPFVLEVLDDMAVKPEQNTPGSGLEHLSKAVQPRNAERILRELPPLEREILFRFCIFDQPWAQICSELNLTDSEFRAHKSGALARLARLWRGEGSASGV